jgi:SAM-dependent methyltransferase
MWKEASMASNAAFVGSVPENYHRYLGPLLFEPYARDLARRVRVREGGRILETACGTGIVTRRLAEAIPPGATLVATDLNEAMIQIARRHVESAAGRPRSGTQSPQRVTFRVADAQELPFADGSFDALVCQFGVMFFPDKPRGMREARRVLARSGRFYFSVWDSLERNPMALTLHQTLEQLFPTDTPDFLRTPFGWNDRAEIERVLRGAGFDKISISEVALMSESPTPMEVARGFTEGNPLGAQLQERGVTDFGPVQRAIATALGEKYGHAPCRAERRALVFEAA